MSQSVESQNSSEKFGDGCGKELKFNFLEERCSWNKYYVKTRAVTANKWKREASAYCGEEFATGFIYLCDDCAVEKGYIW